ncbi:hypothetical protein GGR01_003609 [Acetobacter oeni]|nr:hypothetical protein [Acetobacter oeni]
MLRQGRLPDAENRLKLTDRALGFNQRTDDQQPVRMGKMLQKIDSVNGPTLLSTRCSVSSSCCVWLCA